MTRSKYQRNRPFLVIKTVTRPATGVRTERKGWADNPNNVSVFEQPSVVDSVTTKLITEATVIIDVLEARAVKNGYSGTPEDDVVQHYLTKYRAQVVEAINIWTNREAMRKAKASS